MKPHITIITPCLNAERTIDKTIQSVLSQSFPNFEYLVIDGKSKDSTLSILERYQKKDNRIRVISEKDNSMTEALNRGLKLSSGELVASINADDWYTPHALERVWRCYEIQEFDFLVGNSRFVKENGETCFINKPWPASLIWAWYLMGCLTPESSVFYKRSTVKELGYFDENLRFTQDFNLYLKILKSRKKIVYLDSELSYFVRSENQISTRLTKEMSVEVLSYISYPFLRKLIGGNSLGSLLRILCNVRCYERKQFISHFKDFVRG